MIHTFVKLEGSINNCLLSKLSKPCNEKNYHPEYQVRRNKLEMYIPKLIDLISNVNFRQQTELASCSLYSLLILYLELQTEGPWNSDHIKILEYLEKLNHAFKCKNEIGFDEILTRNNCFNTQEVFDKCIKELHQKMTLDDFKKYPGLIEVYCLLVKNLEKYNVSINPVTVLPVALFMVDDYIIAHKAKGLHCCAIIFQLLTPNDFAVGNYYEVVYRSLKRNIVEKDNVVTQLLILGFVNFLKVLPSDVKKSKLDDVFSSVLDQLHSESNLQRKAQCFNFTTEIIEMHGVHCVKKTIFKDIISDSLDTCSNENVSNILIEPALKCLNMWIRHCWCIWKLPTDQKILSSLFKILYVTRNEAVLSTIQDLIYLLISLSTKDEQKQIYNNLEAVPNCSNVDFLTRINAIKIFISMC